MGLFKRKSQFLFWDRSWLFTGVSFLFGILDAYTATLERAHDIDILRAFGASYSQIMSLLAQKGLLIAVPGTWLGIAMTYFVKWIIGLLLPAHLGVEVVYAWWPVAGTIVAFWAVLGAIVAFRKSHSKEIVHLLSEKE